MHNQEFLYRIIFLIFANVNFSSKKESFIGYIAYSSVLMLNI